MMSPDSLMSYLKSEKKNDFIDNLFLLKSDRESDILNKITPLSWNDFCDLIFDRTSNSTESEIEEDERDINSRYFTKNITPKYRNSNNSNSTCGTNNHNLSTLEEGGNALNNSTKEKITKKQKIFEITKKSKTNPILINHKRLRVRRKGAFVDWQTIEVPREKHFHLDRKKHRLVFQRKHLKVLYSVVGLGFPINFNKCFELIKEHVGDKTRQNFGNKKSFHIIMINGNETITTFADKQKICMAKRKK